jgi:hypothetical protein
MKEPHFSNASTLVLSLGAPLSFLFAAGASPGGWGGGLWMALYFLIGLAITIAVAFALVIIGKIRKEPHTIGSSIVLLVSAVGIFVTATAFLRNKAEVKSHIEETRSQFSEENWAKIVDNNGCPKGWGTGNAGVMAGLWSRTRGGDVYVSPDGQVFYNSPTRNSFRINADIPRNGIYLLEGKQYAYVTEIDRPCPVASPLTVESDGTGNVTMQLVAPHVPAGSIEWNWTLLSDGLDIPKCADLSKAEIEALENQELRKQTN